MGGSVGNWLGGRETREGALFGVEMAESFFVTCASSPWCIVVFPYLPLPPSCLLLYTFHRHCECHKYLWISPVTSYRCIMLNTPYMVLSYP